MTDRSDRTDHSTPSGPGEEAPASQPPSAPRKRRRKPRRRRRLQRPDRPAGGAPQEGSDGLGQALRRLARELRRRVARHPQGHLLNGGPESVPLALDVSTRDSDGWLETAREAASAALDEGLERLLVHRTVFRPGRVYCLRCRSAECEHAAPADGRQVFAGYGPSGVPRYLGLGQWLLERREPRIDLLYRQPQALLAHVTPGAVLAESLLPAFRDLTSNYDVRGQVVAGWYTFPTPDGLSEPVALTFQVVSSQPAEGPLRFGLNLIGRGPGGEPLETLFDRTGELPWVEATRWAQTVLGQIERAAAGPRPPAADDIARRIEGLLQGLGRRLERRRRARQRRTQHGEERHRQPDRPTWKALDDAARAKDEDVFFDTRRETFVVRGERGRAHVFNALGKLVTSIRYSPASIERRRQGSLWRPATREEIANLRTRLTAEAGGKRGDG